MDSQSKESAVQLAHSVLLRGAQTRTLHISQRPRALRGIGLCPTSEVPQSQHIAERALFTS